MIYQVYVGVLILLICSVEKGYGIKCYSCSSRTNESCAGPDTSRHYPVHCDMTILDETRKHAMAIKDSYNKIFEVDAAAVGRIALTCLKVVVRDGNKDYIIRGCQLAEQSNLDICKKLDEHNTGIVQKVHCSKCNVDACNLTSTSTEINIILAIVSAVFCRMFHKIL